MWPSAGLALILLLGLNGSVPHSPGAPSQGSAARSNRREVHFDLTGRGERTAMRATSRRPAPATVRRQHASGQPAMTAIGPIGPVVVRGGGRIGGAVARMQRGVWQPPYAPRAPPGLDDTSRIAG